MKKNTKNIPPSHVNVNAMMIGRYFIYVITYTYLLMTDGILSV